MRINTLQDHIVYSVNEAALYSFEKISLCANSLFSFMKEEGAAWKSFFLNNYYISKLCTLGSEATASIGRKFFSPSNQLNKDSIELPNTPLDELKSSNKAWIRDHSLFHKKYPNFKVSNEALVDVILSKDVDSKGVMKFARKFLAYNGDTSLSQSLSSWEKAYNKQQQIQKVKDQPRKIEQISRDLSQKIQNFRGENDYIVLLFEKEANTTNSPLSYYIKYGMQQIRSKHDNLYQTVYSKVKEQLQTNLNTNWKKKLFTEIQEEIRAILLNQYSSLHQESTLGHNLPSSLQQLLSSSAELSPPKESLTGIIWDLLLQNGINDPSDQPISPEKLNQIFEKEFEMIACAIQNTAMSEINQLVEKAGRDPQPLLQIWHNQLPQKDRGWLEIRHQSDTHCQINLYARDRKNSAYNIRIYGESSPMKVYSYKVPKNLLQTESFLELLNPRDGEESSISSSENIKQFLSRYASPTESHILSGSKVASQGLLDYIKIYHLETSESSLESTEKTFLQMRLHAFINYCKSIENNHNISDETLSNVGNGVSALLESANKLYDAGQLSDEEYIGIISTGLDIEECVIEKQHRLRAEVQSSEIVVPAILKEQVRKMFASSGLSQLDVENIKSFAKVLLGKDMSEEIALLCKELPITTDKASSFVLPHVTLWKTLKTLCIDVKNLRTSPIAVFRVYSDVRKLLKSLRSIIALLSFIPYIYLVVACCTNPVTAVACLVVGAIALYMLFNMPELEPVLNILGAILNFQKEVYTFLLTRLIVRAIQLGDIALHWNKMAPMKLGRSLLTDNISNRLSFSLDAPMDPDQQSIPKELIPLQKFHPDIEIWADTEKPQGISDISLPKLSMEFHIQQQNGIKRAYVSGQSGFYIADVITDRKLESIDFAHLVLENEQGDKKICVVPRSEGRLILQTILKMANSYSRKSVDMLSNYMQNRMLENTHIVYYYDLVDGELASQNFDAISYLITHYITSGDTIRSQKLVHQLKKMKAHRALENPNATLKTLEQISSVLPNLMDSKIAKIILELSTLCTEIPMESKAFPVFLRAYEHYISSKKSDGRSYLSEAQESLLAHHLKDNNVEEQIFSGMGKLALATQTPLVQTLLLLGNNIIDTSFSKFFGKEDYVPASIKNYELQRKYLQGDNNKLSLLMGLMLNNLINPYFSIGKDMVNISKVINANGINILEELPLLISKLNGEKSTLKSDYPLALAILLLYLSQYQAPSKTPITESIKQAMPLVYGTSAVIRDSLSAFLTEPTNLFKLEEKGIGVFLEAFLGIFSDNMANTYVDKIGVKTYISEDSIISPYSRNVTQSGLTTLRNYLDINSKYKQQLLRNESNSTFPELEIGIDYTNLHALEQNILGTYQKINDDFLQKQDNPSNTRPTLDIQRGSSTENQIMNIANWYGDGRDREGNTSSYTLRSGKSRQSLVKSLKQTYDTLQEHTLEQAKTIEDLLMHRPKNLSLLTNRIKEYTQDISNNAKAIEQTQKDIRESSSTQSTIKKIATGVLGYINTLIETPTLGHLQFFKNSQIEQHVKRQKNLLQESESVKSKRRQLFQSIITAFKPETSLSLNEVYAYFCQGKDALIIQSLGLDEDQWKILKEQLYRYMILQKHLSSAAYIHGLSRNATQGLQENIDLIGHQLDIISHSIDSPEESEISIRSRLQFEQKLGRFLPPDLRKGFKEIVNGSMKNFQTIYQFSASR
ncbi:MAG: hypothetical protein ACRCSV_05535 [Chlamydiales bacterium]